jgi:hypothetical protein
VANKRTGTRQRLFRATVPFDPSYITPHARCTVWSHTHPLPPTAVLHPAASPPPLLATIVAPPRQQGPYPVPPPAPSHTRPPKRRPSSPPPRPFQYCGSLPPLDTHLTNLQRQGTWQSSHTPPHCLRPSPLERTLLDKYITFSMSPVYPDLDIQPTGQFTIQMGLSYPTYPSALCHPHGHPPPTRLLLLHGRKTQLLYTAPMVPSALAFPPPASFGFCQHMNTCVSLTPTFFNTIPSARFPWTLPLSSLVIPSTKTTISLPTQTSTALSFQTTSSHSVAPPMTPAPSTSHSPSPQRTR